MLQNLQQNEEILEILESLKGREIICSAKATVDGAEDCWQTIEEIAGKKQGGTNGASVTSLLLLNETWTGRDHKEGAAVDAEVWLVQWGFGNNYSGNALLLIRK